MLLDVGHLPYETTTVGKQQQEPSPRVLPTPAWLMGNLKITTHGKTTLIGKKGGGGVTDWKSVSQNAANSTAISTNNAHLGSNLPMTNAEQANHLPEISVPGQITSSPTKNLKKKLTPMTNLTMHHPNVSFSNNLDSSYFNTPVR